MKKFLCAVLLCVVVVSMPLAACAKIRADRIGENIISNILSTVITDAIRKSGKGGDVLGGEETSDPVGSSEKMPRPARTSGTALELSADQYQSFSEICLAGSIEEFRKKIEYENVSPDAKFVKEDGSEITLYEMAKSSPNPELVEYLDGLERE